MHIPGFQPICSNQDDLGGRKVMTEKTNEILTTYDGEFSELDTIHPVKAKKKDKTTNVGQYVLLD